VRTPEGAKAILRIALTGATGFIGRALQRELLGAGHITRVLVRPGSPNRAFADPRATAIEVALDDRAGLALALADVDLVIYCAGSVRGCDFDDFVPANINGINIIGELLAGRPEARLLLISSLAATRPHLSHYARSKFEGERVLQRHPGLGWTILRPPAVYGPGDVELLPLFRTIRSGLAVLVGPRSQRLSLLHVADLARAVVAWLDAGPRCNQRCYAIDDGRTDGYTWPDIVRAVRGDRFVVQLAIPRFLMSAVARINLTFARCFNRAPMLTPGKLRELSESSWLCDNSQFVADTGWSPQTTLEDGARQLFADRSSSIR
jgi:2-alkyl-3-oxoalkanoate reductase